MRCRIVLSIIVILFTTALTHAQVNVKNYIPFSTWDDACDLRPYIQDAFDSASNVFFGGVGSPLAPPVVYPTTTGLTVPDNHTVQIYADAKILRLPSEGRLFVLGDDVVFKGHEWGGLHSTIDGNRDAHWAAGFTDLGKHDSGIYMGSDCIVTHIDIVNNPGYAFAGIDRNSVRNCIASHCGYIELKFSQNYYAGSKDPWCADGFLYYGNSNYTKDCESYDIERWDYCASHGVSQFNTFENCHGEDIDFRSYGYCDFEAVTLGHNVMINCTARTWAGSNHNNISISQPDCTLTNIDLGQSYLRYDGDNDGNLLNGGTMAFLQLARYWTWGNHGTINMTGTVNITDDIRILNPGQTLRQTGGTVTVGTNLHDFIEFPGGGYDDPNLSTYTVQNSGGVMTIGESIVMGNREKIAAVHLIDGGQVHLAGSASAGDAAIYGITGHAQLFFRGGTMTADPCDPIPVVIGWGPDALADMRGYGTLATGGHLVNNGRVSAQGLGADRDLDLTGVADINNFYDPTGSVAPYELVADDQGWFAFWRGRLLLPTVSVGSGWDTVNWGAKPSASTPNMVNSVQVVFSGSTGGDLDIALLAANRSDVNLTDKVIGVWDMSFSGDFEAASLTIHYDPNQAGELGFAESGLNVYQQQGDGTWSDVTASVNTVTKLMTTVPLVDLGRFIVAPEPSVCGDPGSGLAADLTGDCRVDLADLAMLADDPMALELWLLADQWLECTDPAGCD